MEKEHIIESLSPIERKILPHLEKHNFEKVIEESGLDRTSCLRAMEFLNTKKIIALSISKKKVVEAKTHPAGEERRIIAVGDRIYIEKDDYEKYKGLEIRLKDFCNVKLGDTAEVTGYEIKPTPKIHWVPDKHIVVRVLMPGGETLAGVGEPNILKAKKGEVVQFERFGFVRIEGKEKSSVGCIFSHV